MAEKGGKKAFDLDDLVRRLRYAGADALAARDFASWTAYRESERLKDPTLALKEDRSSYVKPAALAGICRVGDASVVPVVFARLKTVLGRKRGCLHLGRTEVNDAVEFLDRFQAHDPSIEQLFQTILTKRADRLFDGEKRELRNNVPYFANL